jgi:hypothetical protein
MSCRPRKTTVGMRWLRSLSSLRSVGGARKKSAGPL